MRRIITSISGHGESGKDEFAKMLAEITGFSFLTSTSEIVKWAWWSEIQKGLWARNRGGPGPLPGCERIAIEPDEYTSIDDFYADRRNRRDWWERYIGSYNTFYDPEEGIATYKRTIEAGNDFLCGIRQAREFSQCRKSLIDFAVWVERPGIPIDPTQEYGADQCDLVINNDGSLADLRTAAEKVASFNLLPLLFDDLRR